MTSPPLHDACEPLETHAGVDARSGQRLEGRVLCLSLELHEDQVPDLHPAVTLGGLLLAETAQVDLGADVVVELAARAAGTGVAHGPEVVGHAQTDDAVVAQSRDLAPEVPRLVVGGHAFFALEVAEDEASWVQSDLFDQEVPGVDDGLFFEVVAEAEVAQHLEEGVVARARPHVLEIVVLAADADALLTAGRPSVRALLAAGEAVLELHHAGVGEHQRRIVGGNQSTALHDFVAAGPEELEERSAQLLGRLRHGRTRGSSTGPRAARDVVTSRPDLACLTPHSPSLPLVTLAGSSNGSRCAAGSTSAAARGSPRAWCGPPAACTWWRPELGRRRRHRSRRAQRLPLRARHPRRPALRW